MSVEHDSTPVWRTLEERRSSEPRDTRTEHEKNPGALLDTSALLGRRGFMQYTGVTAAAVGLSGCIRRPIEEILPYTRAPEYQVPGIPLHYATAVSHRGDALGLLATQHDGRPTKLEGNPEHTASRGAASLLEQQAIWDLYDPDRARAPSRKDGATRVDATYAEFDEAFATLIAAHSAQRGGGLAVLARGTTSPSFIRLRDAAKARLPEMRFHSWDSVHEGSVRAGAQLAFGQLLGSLVDYSAARIVLSIDSDFLGTEPGAVRASRAFGPTRAIERPTQEMSRLYVVESTFSVTGGSADHRLRVAPSRVDAYVRALARTLQQKGSEHSFDLGAVAPAINAASLDGFDSMWLSAVADDLLAHRGLAPVVLGSGHAPELHALVHSINLALGNFGRCIKHFPPVDAGATNPVDDLKTLVAAISEGSVETLVVLGANPVYDAPADVDVRGAFATQGLTLVHLSSHRDETSELSTWHVPEAHFLETWGDHRAMDGTVSPQQPLIAPLWGGRAPIELLARIAGETNWRSHFVVQTTFRQRFPQAASFGREWRRTLHRGVVAGTGGVPMRTPRLDADAVAAALANTPAAAEGIELLFLPDSRLFDGRYANNIWALEVPDPMTKIVWDNAALMSPATAERLTVRNNDVLRVSLGDANVEIAAFVLPGHADDTLTLHLGWGRSAAGRYGSGHGMDVSTLRRSTAMHHVSGATVVKTGRAYDVVHTQEHGSMEGRPIALDATLEAFRENPRFAQFRSVDPSEGPLWERQDYSHGHQWGMTIDLGSCTGCNACVVACQSENNIPVVGKDEVKRGREMSWMRIDRYFVGDEGDPRIALSPVTCQQCEEAPCENVCPVTATSHTPEGLNDMAYNRCVGTRYCANNCPYKVRRFNYLSWHEYLDGDPELIGGVPSMTPTYGHMPETRKMQCNPNVTVRMRGVMEKCSYCVQRIESVRIASRREQRELRDGDIVTACQQTCPTGAITFGDLNDPRSAVARKAALPRGYHLLAELGVHPRTTFLARIRNANPAMAAHAAATSEEAEG